MKNKKHKSFNNSKDDFKHQFDENSKPNVENVMDSNPAPDCGEGIECPADCCQEQNDQISNLKEELASWQDKYVRVLADCENSKRRAEIDAKNMVDYRISKFAKDILPLADNLSLAIDSIKGKVDDNILNGLLSIQDLFNASLEKNGISKIKTVGEKLNPALHCVVMQVQDPNFDQGVIAKELQAGYLLGDKVIREAMVAVADAKKE